MKMWGVYDSPFLFYNFCSLCRTMIIKDFKTLLAVYCNGNIYNFASAIPYGISYAVPICPQIYNKPCWITLYKGVIIRFCWA